MEDLKRRCVLKRGIPSIGDPLFVVQDVLEYFGCSKKTGQFLEDNYDCIVGSTEDLFLPEFGEFHHEDLFIRLNDSDRINSHFPSDLLIHRMNVLYDFVLRKRLGKQSPVAENELALRTCFYETCAILDG